MAENFDLFNFEHCDSMLDILADLIISVVDAGGQLVPNYPDPAPPPETTCDLGVLSGELLNGGFPTADVRISAEPTAGVGVRWTAEWVVTFEELPEDFSNLVNNHVYFGASDAGGPCAGLFISQIGIAYTGSVHHSAGNLVTDSAVTTIPGSSQYIELGVETVIRIVVDGVEGVVYVFYTPSSVVAVDGHRLIAILPALNAADMGTPPIDQGFVSVRGTTLLPSRIALDAWRMASTLLIPNRPPVADAGADQALRICSIAQLDGSASFDPEGEVLSFDWRLINAPLGSAFLVAGNDGRTFPLGPPTGFTDKFHSASLGVAHAAEPLVAGDVLLLDSVVYDIVSTGSDINGFFVLVSEETIPEPQTGRPYRVLRQYGISGPATPKPTFLPDVLGFYRFDLTVNDGDLDSQTAVVVVNVVDSPLPRGLVHNADFLFNYLSDYWSLLEDRGPIATFWGALVQVTSAELYTLWQHDYSKSLRDIQRTFLRRWLHYDLLLAEPLPELTTLRLLYGGVRTNQVSVSAGANANGTVFRIASAFHSTTTITIASTNPVFPATLATELRNRLAELDSRYTVDLVTERQGGGFFQWLRINAPFPFTISNSTGPVFLNGTNGAPTGTGMPQSSRVLRVSGPGLDGVDVQEDDLLILGAEAYRVQHVIRFDPVNVGEVSDRDIVLKDDIPLDGPVNWTLSGYVRSELLDFYNGLLSLGDAVFFEVVALQSGDETILAETTALGVAAGQESQLGFVITAEIGAAVADPGRFAVRLAKTLRRTYLPIDESVVDVPTLSATIIIENDEETLRRNLDFFIEDYRGWHCFRFESGQLGGPSVWEDGNPPDRLWAEYTYLDNSPTIEANFGLLAEVSIDQIRALPGDVDYLSAVRGIWYAYINGPTLFNLRVGSQILLGLPFAEERGVIEEIRTDFSPTSGRILIRDSERAEIVRSYTFPRTLDLEVNPSTGEAYAVGDSVRQFAPLVQGVEIVDWVKDPRWFEGLINQDIFYEVEKFHTFLVRVDSAVFGVESLSFVQNFILKIKPTITYPLFIVTQDLGNDTEVSITDELEITATVELLDTLCGALSPFSTSFDDARAGGGGYWNQFDTDSNGATPPPTFPTSDTVEWAFDRYVFCPEDQVESHTTQIFSGSALASTGVNFVPADDLYNVSRFMEAGPFTVANGATGEAITAEVGDTIPDAGTIDRVRVLISDGPGADPVGYEVVVAINGVDTIIEAFTSVARFTDVSFVASEAVVATDVITARIRHAGGSPRSPDWTHVRIEVYTNLGAWAGGDTLDPGNYGFNRTLA